MMAHQDGSCAGSLQPDLAITAGPIGFQFMSSMPSMMSSMPSTAGMGMGAMIVETIESLPDVEQKLQAYQMAITALYHMPMLMAVICGPTVRSSLRREPQRYPLLRSRRGHPRDDTHTGEQ
jgi:hypothetical protein